MQKTKEMMHRHMLFQAAVLLALVAECGGGGVAGGPPPPTPRVLFSDIDGTLVHYKDFVQHGVEVIQEDAKNGIGVLRKSNGEIRTCRLVPSSTMGYGYISFR